MTSVSPKRRIALTIVAVACVAGIGYAAFVRGAHDGDLRLYGNVDIRDVTLGLRVAGKVASVEVDEGDAVRAGQVMARLDPVPLQLEEREARASAAALAARVALLKSGYRAEDVEQARAAVAERRAALANADQQLVRQQQLKDTGAVAPRIYEDTVAARDQAHARLASAEAALEELQRGYRSQEIAEAEANEQKALALAAQARRGSCAAARPA